MSVSAIPKKNPKVVSNLWGSVQCGKVFLCLIFASKGYKNLKDYYGDTDDCHYHGGLDLVVLEAPISAAKIKKILERNVVFPRVMSNMADGQKIADAITG